VEAEAATMAEAEEDMAVAIDKIAEDSTRRTNTEATEKVAIKARETSTTTEASALDQEASPMAASRRSQTTPLLQSLRILKRLRSKKCSSSLTNSG
jgi:hypothetical protein